MVRSNTWFFSLKVVFMSTGLLSMALLLKMSVPLVMDFLVSRAPVMWSSFLSWLKPPYLYLVINAIIITIAASSRLCHNDDNASSMDEPSTKTDFVGVASARQTSDVGYKMKMSSDFGGAVVYEEKRRVEEDFVETVAPVFEEKSVVVVGGAVDFSHEVTEWTPPTRMDSLEILTEYDLTTAKPLVSTRFGPEGSRASRAAKPKRHRTLENTWKTITEGNLKKSDTWENHYHHHHGSQINVVDASSSPAAATMKKSEAFRDRTNYQLPALSSNSPASAGKKMNEPSLSKDELNRRVEAFIKKFNEEMRLQRQESLNQYKEMING